MSIHRRQQRQFPITEGPRRIRTRSGMTFTFAPSAGDEPSSQALSENQRPLLSIRLRGRASLMRWEGNWSCRSEDAGSPLINLCIDITVQTNGNWLFSQSDRPWKALCSLPCAFCVWVFFCSSGIDVDGNHRNLVLQGLLTTNHIESFF
jgi:hypothetical protein